MEPAADIAVGSASPDRATRPARGKYRRAKAVGEFCYRLTRALAEEIKRRALTNEAIIALLGENPARSSYTRAEVAAIRAWRSDEFTQDRLLIFCEALNVDPFQAQSCPWGPYGRLAS